MPKVVNAPPVRPGWPKTDRQEAFARLCVSEGLPATVAAERVGYSKGFAHSKASALLKSLAPFVAELQLEKNKVIEKRFAVTIESVVDEFAAIGFANLQNYYRPVELSDGTVRLVGIPLHELPPNLAKAVKSFTTERFRGTDGKIVVDYKYTLEDRQGALYQLGRHIGMFSEEMLAYFRAMADRQSAMDLRGASQDDLMMLAQMIEKIRDARAIEHNPDPEGRQRLLQ